MEYIKNILISLDRLGNTIAYGSIDATISGRTGYYSDNSSSTVRWYWVMLRLIIDFTFLPLDGPGHCNQSYKEEKCNTYKPANGFFFMLLLCFITICSCLPIALMLYLVKFIKIIIIK